MLLVIMVFLLFFMNWWGKRSQQKQMEEHEKRMSEALKPGVWVYTKVGFYGRFVDIDGDVLILETPDGTETYWNKVVLESVSEPPFEIIEPTEDVSEAVGSTYASKQEGDSSS